MRGLPRTPGDHLDALSELRQHAGWPTLRDISERCGVPHNTVAHILNGDTRTTVARLTAVIRALDGTDADVDRVVRQWREDWALAAHRDAGPAPVKAPELPQLCWLAVAEDLRDGVRRALQANGYELRETGGNWLVVIPKT